MNKSHFAGINKCLPDLAVRVGMEFGAVRAFEIGEFDHSHGCRELNPEGGCEH
jgi:hypothetical protein